MIPTLYRGSVKDVLGPVALNTGASTRRSPEGGARVAAEAVVFEYSDAFSVFDWGKMPDLLPRKGESLALVAAELFERLERPETWREFSKSPEALKLRKENTAGVAFHEMGEKLQSEGLRTHYLGVLPGMPEAPAVTPLSVGQIQKPARHLAVRKVSVVKPAMHTVLGRRVPDYSATRAAPAPRLVPLEVVFRFGVPPGSSYFERYPDTRDGQRWDFPVLETFSKLEPWDRHLPFSEALAISGLSAESFQDVLMRTLWVAGYLRSVCEGVGLELADGKLEWAVDERGEPLLVDAIGPDELRILKDGVQLSKEFLRIHYRGTPWYDAVSQAKQQAGAQGLTEWKRAVSVPVPALPREQRDLAAHLYMALANALTGRGWFAEAWSLDRIAGEIRSVLGPGQK